MSFNSELKPEPTAYYEAQGLTLKGPARAPWKTTSCSFHGGSDSMRVNVRTGAFCCMSCGESGGDVLAYHQKAHGLEFVDAAKALGCWVDDGQPAPRAKASPLSPRQALELLAPEITLAAIVVSDSAKGRTPSAIDAQRLRVCAQRVAFVREALQC